MCVCMCVCVCVWGGMGVSVPYTVIHPIEQSTDPLNGCSLFVFLVYRSPMEVGIRMADYTQSLATTASS